MTTTPSDPTTARRPLASAEEVRARLEEFRARRGYINPQQGPLAIALPEVSDAYRVIYKALILDDKHLAPLEKEFVWLSLLCVAEEMGAHHLKLFIELGGTDAQAEAALRIAAWVHGARAYEYLERRWQPHFPGVPAQRAYQQGVDALIAGLPQVPPDWCLLALLCAHSGAKSPWGVRAALQLCYDRGVGEGRMAEAMSQAMWPCGANALHDAAGVWLELIREGAVPASEPFRAWAELPDQDGLVLPPR